jgi:hypothetical protein
MVAVAGRPAWISRAISRFFLNKSMNELFVRSSSRTDGQLKGAALMAPALGVHGGEARQDQTTSGRIGWTAGRGDDGPPQQQLVAGIGGGR